ncbi:unnamed protein product [Leptosia nina]|uniref:Uncharacterized protein n=1 Tax=Leptosia nina TaxID=320188 RepID=A0AAV1JMN6_9NEOP
MTQLNLTDARMNRNSHFSLSGEKFVGSSTKTKALSAGNISKVLPATKKKPYLTHAICVDDFRLFLSLPWRDIFACLLQQLLRVNLTSFLPPLPPL